MLFAGFRANIADFCAESANMGGQQRHPTEPLSSQHTDIRALTAEPDASAHQLSIRMGFHSNHVIATPIANMRAPETGGHAVFHFLAHVSFL